MSQKNDSRSPDEIEAEIHRTRQHMNDTLHELEKKLSPKQIMDTAYDRVRNGGANEFLTTFGKTVKQNPVPFLLTGVGLGWLMMSHTQTNQKAPGQQRHGDGDATRATVPPSLKGTTAVHTGTAAKAPAATEPRPDTVGEATHLGTRQDKKGDTPTRV